MSKKTKLIPDLRFPEFEEDGEWEEKTLEGVCDINPSSDDLPHKFVYIDLQSVDSGILLKKNIIKSENAPSRAQRLLKKEDIIFQMVRPYQKNNYLINPNDYLDYVASTGYAQLRAFQSNIYLFQYVHTDSFVNRVIAKCTGSNYPAINSSDLSKIKVEIPKPDEQQKIAACLSSLDDLIAVHSAKLEALKDHKKGLMQNLFPKEGQKVPDYRFPEFEGDGEWVTNLLEKMTSKVGSGKTPKGGEKNYKTKGRPFVRSQNIGWGCLILDEIAFIDDETHSTFSATEIVEEDVLLNITGASIGRSAIANNKVKGGNVNQHVCIIRTTPELNPFFLNQFLICEIGQNQIDSFQAGGNRQGLNFGQIRSFSISLPPKLKEQQKIASSLWALDELITAESERIKQLQLHKKGLMQGLFPKIV